MRRILCGLSVVAISLTPITGSSILQPVGAQTQDLQQEARQLLKKGRQQRRQGNPQQAIETLNGALTIARQSKNRELEGDILHSIGFTYRRIGQPQQALKYYQQALPIRREVGDRSGKATTLNNIGGVYRSIGQPQQALTYYQQALPIRREVSDRSGKATTLNNIGSVYDDIGQPQQALTYYQQALPIRREVGDRSGEAVTLNNIGGVYRSIGQPQQALTYYQQALPIRREVGDRSGEAVTLNNLGLVYRSIGQPQQALTYYQQALPIRREVGDRSGEAVTLNNIGSVYWGIGQPKQALKYYKQTLPIRRKVGDRSGEATTLNNMGTVYDDIGQPQQALKYYQQALPIRREVGDRSGEATTLSNLGFIYRSIGQSKQALTYYEQALPIFREVGDRSGEETTLNNLGFIYRDTNQPAKAIDFWEQSVKIILDMRAGLVREHRQQFLSAEKRTAMSLTDLLIKEKQADKAFEWINLATTADLADYNRLIDAKVANPEAQIAIDDWQGKNQQLELLRQQLQYKFSEAQARQIQELQAQVNQQAEEIANDFPEVAELFETQPTDIEQLRNNIPQDTLVIQPALLTNTVASFLLTQDNLEVVQSKINPKEFNQLLDQYLIQLEDYQNPDVFASSAQLYEILIRPLEAQIEANSPKHLAIIATGKLRYLPFETLYDQQTDQYLIEKYPIHYLTNISSRSLASSGNSPSSLQTLSLANPQPTQEELKGTEAEAQHLAKNFPGSEVYVGTEATLDTFKTQAPRFSILHLGTHGCFDPEGCDNLGMQANTLLFANNEQYDIANAALLGLNNTELITLSACQTAKKTNADGKEISGLAYIFERAGAKSVIASLWNAEDSTSQKIMIQFYDNLQQGMSKSEAMRQAKLTQIDLNPDLHPWFWSPFILIGDAGK